MSDTPRTDDVVMQAVAQGMRLAPVAEFCRELERENAALNETTKKHVSAYYELLAENAALKEALDAQADYQRELRADRDRLDWLLTKASVDQMIVLTSDASEARKAIDSAMGVSNP